jgi:hypothetical protein
MDLSSVTSCCDIFIGERICFPENSSNCSNSVDQDGNVYGCYCQNVETPPKYKSICRSQVSTDSPFIAVDPDSQFYYLCIPAFGWSRFGSETVNGLFNYSDGINDENKINLGSDLQYFSDPPSLEIEELRQLLCEQTQTGPGGECNKNPDQDCVCRVIVSRPYEEQDPEGINAPITFTHTGGIVCSRDLYGSGPNSCETCPEETAQPLPLDDNTFSFQKCTQPSICEITGCYTIDPSIPNCGPTNPQQCGECTDPCSGDPILLTKKAFATFKKLFSFFETNLYRAGNLLLNPNTSTVSKIQVPPLNPCDVIPGECQFAGTFIGYKSKIERNSCPPDNWIQSQTCKDCGCIKEQTQTVLRCSATDLIKEEKSWETWMCVLIQESTANNGEDYYEGTAMEITLNPCLFAGLTPVEALAKATQLIKLEEKSIQTSLCGEEQITINGYRLTACLLCLDLASSSASDAAAYINACVGGFAYATVLDDLAWFGERRMNCNVCEEFKKRPGDIFEIEYSLYNGGVKATIKFKSKKYEACVLVKSNPVCDTQLGGSADDCYNFVLSETKGNIFVQYKSNEAVSYPEWANGTRWEFTTISGDGENPNFQACAPFNEQIGPQDCILYKRSDCVYRKPDLEGYTGKCCTINTNCSDNEIECTSINSIGDYCTFCENQQCTSSGSCSTNGDDACCNLDQPPDCQYPPCTPFQGCTIISSPIPSDVCTTQIGSLFIF